MSEHPQALLLQIHRTMYSIRRFEETVSDMAKTAMIPSFMIHLYVGQEAIAAGVGAALRPDDYMVSTHRGHGHLIAKGGELHLMMAELLGKESGYCRGRGGSMHITSAALGSLGANGIVGAGLVIAPGAALSAKMRGTDQVTACFFGDGASNQGTFHEGLNLAATWRLPVVFVCENNGYGFSTPQSVHQSVKRVSQRAQAYDIPGITVDGNDVLAVYDATLEAVARARRGEGPSLIEATTFRWHGHFEDDEDDYRTAEEKAEYRLHCPIDRFEAYCGDAGLIDPDQFAAVRAEVDRLVEEAKTFADEAPDPSPDDDPGLVYAGGELS
ncbi:MAG: thiamine pyrophosphate-dependent dehydrogenase E1 component subunit alpha [Candidatus Geothermincolia bacterium]